ncbi:hypothetical protein [Chitinophaga tropicalis]|uniref:Uncharacterized protein n=1 Tax=Chitinophaga tropicalis TaxID=2683588 RepID=A0A7K1U5L2_9BACT|nr:hypothetical protein [Chitinophaga tropicalis]MVT09651.1 hypothetical protein [Chitinophaga tropicalis]
MRRHQLVKKQRGHAAERLHNDPIFEGTRKHWQEFSVAGQGALLLRQVMESIITRTRDRKRYSALVKVLLQVLKTDTSHILGERQLLYSDLHLLKGVEFNYGTPFEKIFRVNYYTTIKRKTGSLQVTFTPFNPQAQVIAPLPATHFKITTAAAALDFNKRNFLMKWHATEAIPLNDTLTGKMTATVKLNGGKHPLLLFLHLSFFNDGQKLEQEIISIVDISVS